MTLVCCMFINIMTRAYQIIGIFIRRFYHRPSTVPACMKKPVCYRGTRPMFRITYFLSRGDCLWLT